MLEFFIHLVVTALLLLVVAYLVPGVQVEGMKSALIAALILGVVNALVRPFVVVLTIPLTIVTLGLFLLAINALMFLLTSKLVPGSGRGLPVRVPRKPGLLGAEPRRVGRVRTMSLETAAKTGLDRR
jgi:putative membrane protein